MPNHFNNAEQWLEFDKQHLWHPYTSMFDALPCYPVVGAKGVNIKLANGETLIDGMASWWSAVHGYNQPKLNQAIIDQTQKMAHIMFGGIAHQPASELGARLLDMTPDIFQHIFLADSGSISIEVALKMALQYYQSANKPQKNRFLTVKGGYHGDPFSCMSVGDPINGQHQLFPTAIAKHHYVTKPSIGFNDVWDDAATLELEQKIEQYHNEIAAIIVEPIVQGGVGMRIYHAQYLKKMRELCDAHDILLIFDEIATGFGRTGKLFAMEHADVMPDIMCVGKAITGGMMTLAATITTSNVATTISKGDVPVLMHGPTFMANPLACAVASASIDLLLEKSPQNDNLPMWEYNVKRIEKGLQVLKSVQDHAAVNEVRILGAIGVIETKEIVNVAQLQEKFVEKGVWVRPFGTLVYIMPPYVIGDDDLKTVCNAMVEIVSQL